MSWREFNPSPISTNVTLGLVAGIETVIICLSYASLIFSGALEANFLTGVTMLLMSSVIILITHSLLSVFPTVEASPQKQPLAIIALIAVSLGSMNLGSQLFSTLWVTMACTAVITAAAALLMGMFKLGNLIRYVPFPVTAGFLAGTGWITLNVTLSMLARKTLTLSNWQSFLAPNEFKLWGPAVILSLIIFFLKRNRYQRSLVIPLALFAATIAFYLATWFMHIPSEKLLASGWLLGPFSADRLWSPPNLDMLAQTNWTAVFSQANSISVILLVSLLDCLLHLSIIELVTQQEMDINKELRVFGLANILSGLSGGFLGSLVPNTAAFQREGGTSRIIGLLAAGFCIFVLFAGTSFIVWIPRCVLGGLLLYFGLTTITNSLQDGWKKLSKLEFFTLLSILMVIAFLGLVEGAVLGIVLSIILFVINYSRVEIVKHALTGHTLKSSLQRTPREQKILLEQGDQLLYLKLHGYIFFGTANSLFDEINEKLESKNSFNYLILDFKLVDGLDSSASMYIAKLEQLAKRHPFTLILTEMDPRTKRQVQESVHLDTSNESDTHIFTHFDQAVEWCEDTILGGYPELSTAPRALIERLQDLLPEPSQAASLLQYFKRIEVPASAYICKQGEPADALYFIEAGLVSIFIEQVNGEKTRLRKIGPNNIIGEMGLYTHAPRSASVIADENSILHELSLDALRILEEKDPSLAANFHKLVIQILIERLDFRNKQVSALAE